MCSEHRFELCKYLSILRSVAFLEWIAAFALYQSAWPRYEDLYRGTNVRTEFVSTSARQ